MSEIYPAVYGTGNESEQGSENTFATKWGWYATIDELAGGDIAKFEIITELNLHLCLNNLCYKIEKAKKEAEELRKINRKYGR